MNGNNSIAFLASAIAVLVFNPAVLYIIARSFLAMFAGVKISSRLSDSAGKRRSSGKKALSAYGQYINKERSDAKKGYFAKLSQKMLRCGYKGKHAGHWYFTLKVVFPAFFFLASCISNYPRLFGTVLTSLLLFLAPELFLAGRKKSVERLFQRNAYKIYQYLYNQISSGIKVPDAIKGLYEVMEEGILREVLIRLSARYELTRDIDVSLEEVRARFDFQEAETLCIALKQGIATGDNSGMIARQEEVMFSKYLNYIQVQTERCKLKSLAAICLFTAIMVIMVMIPIFMDVSDSMSRIFVF